MIQNSVLFGFIVLMIVFWALIGFLIGANATLSGFGLFEGLYPTFLEIAFMGAFGFAAAWYANKLGSEFATKGADADFILGSYSEYTALYDDLIFTRELWRQWQANLAEFDTAAPREDGFKLAKEVGISDSEWERVRRIKGYYKSRIKMRTAGYISEQALVAVLDRGGSSLIFSKVEVMDKWRFYTVPERQAWSEEELEREFRADFAWYSEMAELFGAQVGKERTLKT